MVDPSLCIKCQWNKLAYYQTLPASESARLDLPISGKPFYLPAFHERTTVKVYGCVKAGEFSLWSHGPVPESNLKIVNHFKPPEDCPYGLEHLLGVEQGC